MKLRDIEKNLKREQDGKSVPDVYSRVKKAPLNKLLTGETPARAFQKQMAMMTLVIVLVLFSVAAIALTAMWLYRSDSKPAPDCYVRVTVSGEDGVTSRFGVLIRPEMETVSIVGEMENGEVSEHPIVMHSSHIIGLINPKQDDKVAVSVFCDDVMRGYYIARTLVSQLESEFDQLQSKVSASCNDYFVKLEWVDYINGCGGDVSETDGIAQLLNAYISIF